MKKYLFSLSIASAAVLGLATTLTDEFEIVKNLEIFSNIYKEVNTYYVDDVIPDKTIRHGLEAMLHSLDPYTSYISPEDVEQFNSNLTGKYVGVGASITLMGDYATVTEVYPGGPAQQAGLQIGDQLLSSGNTSLKGMAVKDIIQLLRGAAGTKLSLSVKRPGQERPLSLDIKRNDIKINHVPAALRMEDGIVYLSLNSFSENVGRQLALELQKFQQQGAVKGIILDLRNNSGGLLLEAVNVANLFLPKFQLVVQTKGRDLEKNQNYYTLNPPVDLQTPLVILINEQSASASEIVAGAIQDLDRGVIIGRRSFGKGLVQHTKDLSYGAKIKITTARYYIPSGRCIQASQYQNGLPVDLPDSARALFKTKAGRKVYDGGGIAPDLPTHDKNLDAFIRQLQNRHFLFDFATEYKIKHPSIASPKDFRLNDADFAAFLSFLQQKNYQYETELDVQVRKLEQKIKEEQYDQAVAAELAELKSMLSSQKQAFFQRYKSAILRSIQNEILRRYYFESGMLEGNLQWDPDVRKAVEVLLDSQAYQSVLSN
jgi:carboxyl-terminal processing protease